MKTQTQRLKDYLDKGKSLTRLEAYHEIGTMKLPARIHDIINEGYPILKESIKVVNRFGESIRVMKYSKDVQDN